MAEKLGIPQVTYAESITSIEEGEITILRRLERGVEEVSTTFPVLITVNATAPACRPRNAKQLMRYKHATTLSEQNDNEHNSYLPTFNMEELTIPEWGVADVGGEEVKYGLSGSPTKVKKIENIVFQAKESKRLTSSEEDIDSLFKELISSHTIG